MADFSDPIQLRRSVLALHAWWSMVEKQAGTAGAALCDQDVVVSSGDSSCVARVTAGDLRRICHLFAEGFDPSIFAVEPWEDRMARHFQAGSRYRTQSSFKSEEIAEWRARFGIGRPQSGPRKNAGK